MMQSEQRRYDVRAKTLAKTMRLGAVIAIAGAVMSAGLSCKSAAKAPEPVAQPVTLVPSTQQAPAPKSEFRGIWVASVNNINWPSKPGLPAEQQKAELIRILDRAAELNLNAVLFQVRPSTDALYESKLEPWSVYLTGRMGKSPGYDPLAFAIAESHKRGLELHAWINPFRVKMKGGRHAHSADSLAVRHPDWVRNYGGMEWLDPGEPAAREHSLAVVEDIVRRYDVDGIHIDDYFYPYREADGKGGFVEFPDAETYARYGAGRSRGDFRRGNIDDFVKQMYERTKRAKPWVKVGISPFGIWRPGHPAQIKGMDSYEIIYGDSLKWLREGWADYFSPQLYWPIAQTPQSFPVLLNWWIGENTRARHIWPGLFSSRADAAGAMAGGRATWTVHEVEYQIKIARGFAGSTGVVLFSGSILQQKTLPALYGHLKDTVYGESALVPASPWLAGSDPGPGRVSDLRAKRDAEGLRLTWAGAATKWHLVRWLEGRTWKQRVVPGNEAVIAGDGIKTLGVSGVDRFGRVGPETTVDAK